MTDIAPSDRELSLFTSEVWIVSVAFPPVSRSAGRVDVVGSSHSVTSIFFFAPVLIRGRSNESRYLTSFYLLLHNNSILHVHLVGCRTIPWSRLRTSSCSWSSWFRSLSRWYSYRRNASVHLWTTFWMLGLFIKSAILS